MEANHDDHYNPIMAHESRNMIIKGKRTKRSRPSSPLSLKSKDSINTQNPNNSSIEFTKIIQENDEEDMANCLILLAQSQSLSTLPPPLTRAPEALEAEVHELMKTSEFYVYECKTCNRGFSSFQALGGHRASHKKQPSKPNHVDVDHRSTDLSLQIGSNHMAQCNPSGSMMKGAKVHECSICGAEFGSGQALGGHMRRHRSMPLARNDCGGSGMFQESKKQKNLLSLDLNLPTPIEDDLIRETKFRFGSNDQMIIVFSNSSLVRCHI